MSKKKSFRMILLSDLKRKFNALNKEVPKNNLILITFLIMFVIRSKGFRSIFFYRLISIKLMKHSLTRSFFLLLSWLTFCIEIPYTAKIGKGFLIGHHDGVIINGNCSVGENFTIQQGVTLGGNMYKRKNNRSAPLIGDNVFIGPGAKILGPVEIGNNCIIGANSVISKDIPENSIVFGIPGKVIKKVKKTYIELETDHISSLKTK